jgi:pilus assembly protein Flp/PilA
LSGSAPREIARRQVLHVQSHIERFLKNESGATAIEYGLVAAGIAVAVIAAVNGIGTALNAKFKSISTQM